MTKTELYLQAKALHDDIAHAFDTDNKLAVTRVLEALGPERVQLGLDGWHEAIGQGWQGCFLARCWGRTGALAARIENEILKQSLPRASALEIYCPASDGPPLPPPHLSPQQAVGTVLGVNAHDVHTLTSMFDNTERRPRLRALVEEWLELNRLASQPRQLTAVSSAP